jgi:small subunit ribosomal protein S2
VKLSREFEKLQKNLSGIKDMNKPPKAVVIVDLKKEHIAIKEAHTLKIPIVALLDTNCDPDEVDYPIPANDDSIRSISLFVEKLAHACKEGDVLHQADLAERRQKSAEKEEEAKNQKQQRKKSGPKVEVISKQPMAEISDANDVEDEKKEDEKLDS